MNYIWFGTLLTCTLVLTGCNDSTPNDKADGKALFAHYCESCHGQTGNGKFLQGIPANAHTALTRQEVINLVLYGRDDKPAMPNFRKQLSPRQAQKVADYLLFTLKAQ
ncbi:cytochrome c [Pontibacterium sp. N1Y112]|uniref:Cytochrome c n=1 Tax=Pontibacterium sinense TaxID=2781979 RepID=A0A8J7FKA8_9GAMM|nr:cytochrome c [Pontibacterium sinense]MBE9399623.1 cytochrome c [Pontibacterium sinense]